FIPGAEVEVVRYAPLKDPVDYLIKGYHVSLRHEEAEKILVDPL
ncbi:MAG TPA: ferrous iron transport protein A, partial [Thermodesulfatator sp.]|nr:ferrous iron transport protein A [Thermodesulfatator sp.]